MRTQSKSGAEHSAQEHWCSLALSIMSNYRVETLVGNIGTIGHTETRREMNSNRLQCIQAIPFLH